MKKLMNNKPKSTTESPFARNTVSKWGFLRETREMAAKVKYSNEFGIAGTVLEDYLAVIFPNVHDWVHNKSIPHLRDLNGRHIRRRPDFRSEQIKTIIEFDGLQHYTNPDKIRDDEVKTRLYESAGYKVVRIPYFVQLTNEVVKELFGLEVSEPLFPTTIPSMTNHWQNTPAYLCPAGIRRMAKEYKQFPQQYTVNMDYLRKTDVELISEYWLLESNDKG